MAWRERRKQEDQVLQLWEVLAEEFEGSEEPLSKIEGFDDLAEAAVAARHALDRTPSKKELQENWERGRDKVESVLLQVLRKQDRTAVCFSGGGVRSATFGLGVLQGLAGLDTVLAEFDYLSTVSGGGYLGSWFSAWAAAPQSSPAAVAKSIAAAPASVLDGEARPLRHLREYCAFLDPKLGLFSPDTWTLAATIFRNMILNWLVLIPIAMLIVLLPSLYLSFLPPEVHWYEITTPMLILGFLSGVFGTTYILAQLPKFCGTKARGEKAFVGFALIPLIVSALALTIHWAWRVDLHGNYPFYAFAAYGGSIHLCAVVCAILYSWWRGKKFSFGLVWTFLEAGLVALVSGMVAGSIAYLLSELFVGHIAEHRGWYVCLAMPIVLLSFCLAALLSVGLLSERTGESDREWWSRAGGWLMMVSSAWLVASVAVNFGPVLLRDATTYFSTLSAASVLGAVASRLGFSPKTSAGASELDKDLPARKSAWSMDVIAQIAGVVFLLILVAVLAATNEYFIRQLGLWPITGPTLTFDTARIVAWLGFLLIFAYSFSAAVNVNRFSLHSMYRNRLVRTYPGASNKNREKDRNPFIDMADSDNPRMANLSPSRPLHVVNITLNLVDGGNLAWQQRKAESFTSTRLRTGSLRVGYQPSASYGAPAGGISLGAAMAISGAAASPNMGYHSSSMLSLVMTLFNARLGWWLANPGHPGKGKWGKDGPTISFHPIINEALGRTNDTGAWVYLSDGGHFENLGLYEMVLRRCARIIVVDGSQDLNYQFEDLANAVRKIRVDLGIPIEFDGGRPVIFAGRNEKNRYCGTAKIHYSCVDKATADGTLVYIKACLNGSEPTDVQNYAAVDPDFPQQGTEQLWFNESQFESYRTLGHHIVTRIVQATTGEVRTVDEFMRKVKLYCDGHSA